MSSGCKAAFEQIGILRFDGQSKVEALRLYALPKDAPALLYGCPSLPAGARTLALETSWNLPSLASGATANVDVAVPSVRRGDFADASLDTSSIAFVLDCHVCSNDQVRVTARNISASTVDLAAAPQQQRPYAGHMRRGGGARQGRSSRRAPSPPIRAGCSRSESARRNAGYRRR